MFDSRITVAKLPKGTTVTPFHMIPAHLCPEPSHGTSLCSPLSLMQLMQLQVLHDVFFLLSDQRASPISHLLHCIFQKDCEYNNPFIWLSE